jgi:hypothetical protein
LWSAAAATGEEPYSLAMALIEAFGRDDLPAGILATDIDVEALAVAQRGEYADVALQAMEPARRERFLSATGVARRWSIAPAVRRLVEFRGVRDNPGGVAWASDRGSAAPGACPCAPAPRVPTGKRLAAFGGSLARATHSARRNCHGPDGRRPFSAPLTFT